ncbi:MAG: DUF3795 domain-containing protein [Bacteroidales bacterium]|nr:DUF3795 domain-containing protein [Bacteroidales bacterium]MCF8333570.1 DUF3795 domain-containing protein [Bacteroidales bacterium]
MTQNRQHNQEYPHHSLAPCGVFCAACPSFKKTCLGCSSEERQQKRTSKWNCRIRDCCLYQMKLSFCVDCEAFPCSTHRKKLVDSHRGDPRFAYRHEIPEQFPKLKSLGLEDYLAYQRERYSCPDCGAIIQFYRYTCSRCGKEVRPE